MTMNYIIMKCGYVLSEHRSGKETDGLQTNEI